MVKRSTKSKSKRTSIRKKHKIADKIRAHNRKKRRADKKKAKQNKANGIRPTKRDPGVPSTWPFREEFIKEMKFEKGRILAELKNKKKPQVPKVEEDKEMEVDGVELLAASAREKTAAYDSTEQLTQQPCAADSGREHFKDFRKVVSLADVVLLVLDARDPQRCRSNEVETLVRQFSPQKRLVFLLNKTDLVSRENIEKWLQYLRQFAPTIAFKCSTQRQSSNLGQSKGRVMESKSSVCLGADHLIQLLKNYTRNADIRTAITVGLVGVPNVGKSSVINSLKRSRATHVGNKAGVTTNIQEVHLDKQIRLLDSPGVIYDNSQRALPGVINVETIADPVGAVEQIVQKVGSITLKNVYGILDGDTAQSLLQTVAQKTGKLMKGGLADVDAAAKIVIQDWNNGKIPFSTLPPSQIEANDVQVVEDWSNLFTLDGLLNDDSTEPAMNTTASPEEPILGEKDAYVAEALEAFRHMSSMHQSRAEVNKAANALTNMNLQAIKEEEKQTQPDTATATESSEVVVLHRQTGDGQPSGAVRRPMNESLVSASRKRNQDKRIRKKKAKERKRKVKSLDNMTDSMAKDLKL